MTKQHQKSQQSNRVSEKEKPQKATPSNTQKRNSQNQYGTRKALTSKHSSNAKSAPSIGVSVPFAFGEHKFRVLPAKHWGHYEHFLLQVIAETSYSAQQLAIEAKLPYQLIIEIMIPFMRVGWVALVEDGDKFLFKATEAGIAVSKQKELPSIKDPQDKKRSFVIDPITGDCYRTDFRSRNRNNSSRQSFQVFGIEKINKQLAQRGKYAAKLSIHPIQSEPDLETIFSCVALDGEEVISFEQRPFDEPYGLDIRYAIAEVDVNGDISGMPERISEELKEEIIRAANKQREKIKTLGNIKPSLGPETIEVNTTRLVKKNIFASYTIPSNKYNLILGGLEHKRHLNDMINEAHSRLIIHSTFINPKQLSELMPLLLETAKRAVQVDIMWGQLDPDEMDESGTLRYQEVVEGLKQIQQNVYNEGLESFLKIHLDPSGSHAKFIICDHKTLGYCATFGSCNWLASGFYKFEASVCVSSLPFVADAVNAASTLARGKLFIVNSFSQELARLSKILKSAAINCPTAEHNTSLATICLVGANDHEDYLLKARDEANQNIFVCSHRVSYIADNSILPTILSNKTAKKTAAYGRATGRQGGMTARQANDLKSHYEAKGFTIVLANEPQIHAKILAWDSNQVLITSLNWLSASSNVDAFREIGVYVKDTNITQKVVNSFNN